MNRFLIPIVLVGVSAYAQTSETPADAELEAPAAFTANCMACHLVDQAVVGPSLVEIAELYPEKNREEFIQWCIEPGKKRDQMLQMPSMVHIPVEELNEIYDYIRIVTVGVQKVKTPTADPYALSPAKTKRPRVERTFVPNSGPASIIVALPTSGKHNVIWDTDVCRLRYISEGEPDNWPYLRSNGNSLAVVGSLSYVEEVPLFSDDHVQYKGYRLSDDEYPSFEYTVGEFLVTESISVEADAVVRTITGSPRLPEYEVPADQGTAMKVVVNVSGDTLVITHKNL